MIHVKLPIYDGDIETNNHVEVSVALLEYLASISVAWKDHVKVVAGPTVEQEMDLISRIIHGLPTQSERMSSAHYRLHHDGQVEQLVKPEEVEFKPHRADGWREIPGFPKYEMSAYRAIAVKDTGLSVSIEKGRLDNVLLADEDGNFKRMSVNFLFGKTFPEH